MSRPQWLAPQEARPGDPYLQWAQACEWTGLSLGPGTHLSFLVRRRSGDNWAQLQKSLPSAARLRPPAKQGALHASLDCPVGDLPAVMAQFEWVELAQPLQPYAPQALPAFNEAAPDLVIGVIDQGGAPLQRCFGDPDRPGQTRLRSFWDQSEAPTGADWRAAPAGYGRVLDGETLNRLYAQSPDARSELNCYRELGLMDLVEAATAGRPDHATHVLDTLAGLPAPMPAAAAAKPARLDHAARAALVLVSVPATPARQSTGTASLAQLLDAMEFVLQQAQALAPRAPVLINLSLGVQAGPHDGTMAIERAIDDMMRMHPQLLVLMAAGNRSAQAMNASGRLSSQHSVEAPARLAWRLQPQDPSDSFLELWWRAPSREAAQALRWRVCPPGSEPSAWLAPGQVQTWAAGSRPLACAWAEPGLGLRGRALLALAPVLGARGGVPAGPWWIELALAGSSAELRLDAWVQGDQPRLHLGAPVQSYLEAAIGLGLEAGGSLNALATGGLPLVVGAATADEGRPSVYAARSPHAAEVQALGAADESVFAPGLLAAGPLSGQWMRMAGSSVATPVVARHWANALAEGLRLPVRNAAAWRHGQRAHGNSGVWRPGRPSGLEGLLGASAS
ncbi:hypothetical protein HNQ51_003341 [Inhella inkyongensis]|uniref:Peptidase S8/S53 domain-containing protein n=1 Tax=Inhella inkyongensis TaxID=392593 RepID=A0A840SCD3_9BURK|nr:S8 family serine peptidase [Inhella inkyongensis]MBB5206010.1 hypothetical protein [Inhella inkyongensis]